MKSLLSASIVIALMVPAYGADLPMFKGAPPLPPEASALLDYQTVPQREYCQSPLPDFMKWLPWPCDPEHTAISSGSSPVTPHQPSTPGAPSKPSTGGNPGGGTSGGGDTGGGNPPGCGDKDKGTKHDHDSNGKGRGDKGEGRGDQGNKQGHDNKGAHSGK